MPTSSGSKAPPTPAAGNAQHGSSPLQPQTSAARDASPREDTVTSGMRIAAAWSWRFLVVVAALAVLYLGLGYLSEITVPVTIALLLCALLNPVKRLLVNHGWNPGLASTVVFIGGVLVVTGIISLVVEQFVAGAAVLAERVTGGLDTVQNWLVTGPLQLSQDQIDSAATSIKQAVLDNREAVTSSAVTTAASVGRVVTGLVLVMFILFFFLRDGRKIWTWIVGLAPRRSRTKIHDAADQAWWTLAGYVRATVLVAFVDAIGIGLGLVILGVPLALPLTAFVFLASFIPIIGALVSGVVAVLVALVTVGLVKALIVLAVVIAVQQLESHVLQPVLMGRAVHVHPLAVALSIAAGVIIAGISGALLAVPIAACANAVVKSLAGKAGPPAANKDKVEQALDRDDATKASRTIVPAGAEPA